jgi:hypothetical protein
MRRLLGWVSGAIVLSMQLPAMAEAPWALRYDGVGPVKIGMHFAEANRAAGGGLQLTPLGMQPTKGCDQIAVPGHPGVTLMIIDDVVARIDVFRPHKVQAPELGVADAAGVMVGDPVAKVLAAWSGIERAPDAYDEREQYLTRYAGAADPQALAVRYTTDNGKVGAMIAGHLKAVRYIEGCL